MTTPLKSPWFIVAACAAIGACAETAAPPKRTMRVGAILAVTGPASPLGGSQRAVLMGMSEDRAAFNGIELDIRDSAGDTARARVLFDSLAADPEIVAVIGPSTSAESIANARAAQPRWRP